MKIKVATAQINYLPAIVDLDPNSGQYIVGEKSPFLYNETNEIVGIYNKFKDFERKFKGIKNFSKLMSEFEEIYVSTLNAQIEEITKVCHEKKVNLLTFPEYSIPIKSLGFVDKLSKKYNITIIAGSHTLTYEGVSDYFFEKDVLQRLQSNFEYIAACPVFTPNENHVFFKQFSSRYDDNLTEVEDKLRQTITVQTGDGSFKIGIAICKEFLSSQEQTTDFKKLEKILLTVQESDVIAIISLNKDSRHFKRETNTFLNSRKHGGRINIIYSNYSLFGGSYIQSKGETMESTQDITEECLLIREIHVGTGGGAAYSKPSKASKKINILPKTNFFTIVKSALDGIEEVDLHEEIFALGKRNLPSGYKDIVTLMINHINSGPVSKARLEKIVNDRLLLLNKHNSVSYLLAHFFEEVKKYIDKTFDPNWEIRYDSLLSKLNQKLRKLREHGVIIAYSSNQHVAYPELNSLHKLKSNEEHSFQKFVTQNNETEFNFCVRITSSPSEDIGIAYQIRLITQLIDILKGLGAIKFIEYRFITSNSINQDEGSRTEVLLLFGFDFKDNDSLVSLCQEMFITINIRLIGITIEPVEVDSIWFKDFVINKSSSNKKFINPKKTDQSERFLFQGRGEASNIIKVLSSIKGINIYSLRIYRPDSSEKGYTIKIEEPRKQDKPEIITNVNSTLRDLQDLQEASSSFQFQHPLYSPNTSSSFSPDFRCSIWVQTEHKLNENNLLIHTIAHEISGIGRYEVSDVKDKHFKVCEKELYHLLRFPFGSIPGFAKKHFGQIQLSFNDYKYEVPKEGIYLGDTFLSRAQNTEPFYWEENNRDRHAHIIGKTGTGKSYFLASMISQDILNGGGLMVIDPHGDLIDLILSRIPNERRRDIIFFDPGDTNFAPGLNIFEADYDDEAHKAFVIEEAVSIFIKLYGVEIFGPRIQHYFREGVTSLMEYRNKRKELTTLADVSKLFIDEKFRGEVKESIKGSGISEDFWMMFENLNSREEKEMLPYFQSKFAPLVSNYLLSNIVSQQRSMIDFNRVINEDKIILVNLSKGKLRELNSSLLGMVLVAKLNYAVMGRAKLPPNERKLFTLYVDEFQNFASSTFASMLSEARKYKLSMVLANQYLNQLKLYSQYTKMYPDSLIESVLGNCGTLISFRIGNLDAEIISSEIQLAMPSKHKNPLIDLDNYQAIVSTNINGKKIPPFLLKSRIWDKEQNYKHNKFLSRYKIDNCLEILRTNPEISNSAIEHLNIGLDYFDIKNFVNVNNESIVLYSQEVEPLTESINKEKWYIKYVSKFNMSSISFQTPNKLRNDFSWPILIQLCASSLSGSVELSRAEDGNVYCKIAVESGDDIKSVSVQNLNANQTKGLFKIFIMEHIRLQYLIETSEHERKRLLIARNNQLSHWRNVRSSFINTK